MAGWSGYSEKGQGSEERGPGTFTFQPPGTPRAEAANAVAIQAGVQRTQDVTGSVTYDNTDDTLNRVLAFGATLAQPAMQEIKDQKFLEGMTRAAAGEELTAIVNEQPWYSRIFGEATAVQGARAYSAQAAAAKITAGIEEAMPQLRMLPPGDVPRAIMDMSKEHLTGDEQADTLIQMNMLKTFPTVIKQHAREHYKYQQEEASKARFDAQTYAAQAFNAAASNSMSKPEDLDVYRGVFYDTLQLAPGSDPQSWEAGIKTLVASLGEQGQFHAVNELERSGVIKALKPEVRLVLEKQLDQYRRSAAREAIGNYAEQILAIEVGANTGAFKNGEEVFKAYDAINEAYTKSSGNTAAVVGKIEKVRGAFNAIQAIMKRDSLLAKQALSAGSDAARQDQITQLTLTAGTKRAEMARTPDGKAIAKWEVEDAFMKVYRSKDADTRAAMLMADAARGGKVDLIAADIQELSGGLADTVNDNFLKLYDGWKKAAQLQPSADIPNPVHATYYSPKVHAMLQRFDTTLAGRDLGQFAELAYNSAKTVVADPGYSWSKDEQPKLAAFIKRKVTGNTLFGGAEAAQNAGNQAAYLFGTPKPLYGASALAVSNAMARSYGTLKQGGPATALEDSFKWAEANGLEVYGQHAWTVGQGRKTLAEKLAHRDAAPITKVEIAESLNATIDARIKAITSKSPDDVYTIRMQDAPDGDPYFAVYARVDGVVMAPTYVTGTDLVNYVKQKRAAPALEALAREDRIARKGSNWAYGPALTMIPPDDMPAPSASPEAWAAYRKAQASKKGN